MYKNNIHVLIFPCETNSNELHDALSYCYNVTLYGASSIQRHGKYIYKNYYSGLPYITDTCFLQKFNEYLDANEIDIILTTHDTVAVYLAEHQEEIHSKIVQSNIETVCTCRSKVQTHTKFNDCAWMPIRYQTIEEVRFPAFVKPDIGEGGHGSFVCWNMTQLSQIIFDECLVTEYLSGDEYTVDCFTDKNGELAYVSPRLRNRIWGGIAVSGRTVNLSDEVLNIAKCINSRLKLLGLWYFQLRADSKGCLKLLEVSVRCAGTMCMTRAKGVNLPLLTVYAALGYDTHIFDNGHNIEMDRALIGRYNLNIEYSNVYIDFDDTILIRGNINMLAMCFIYQCRNNGKNVHLLTKHINNIYDTLSNLAISHSLFKSIIPVQEGELKSRYIKEKDAIFIDNMFKERIEVHDMLGIPVFDADAFEFLLDWRV